MSKKNKKTVALQPISIKSYIVERARRLPFYKCWTFSADGEGKKQVIVSRQMANGKLVVAFYLIDYYCLGLKDTFYRDFEDIAEFEDIVFGEMKLNPFIELEEVSPNYAQNFIYGAIEYAEDLGFAPHRDFKITEYMLDDVEEIEYMEIEFGDEGKPHYVPGPDDNVEKNLAILNKTVGEANFKYTEIDDFGEDDFDEDDFVDEYDEELDQLDDLSEEEMSKLFEEKVKHYSDSPELSSLFALQMLALMEIQDFYENEDFMERHIEERMSLIQDIKVQMANNFLNGKFDMNEEGNDKIIALLIENYIKYETPNFIYLKDFEKASRDFIKGELSIENFKFYTTANQRTVVAALRCVEEIAKHLFNGKRFEGLNQEQRAVCINFLYHDLEEKVEASKISEAYEDAFFDFEAEEMETSLTKEDIIELFNKNIDDIDVI